MAKHWILYDGRAEFQDTDECAIFEAFSDESDLAKNLPEWDGYDAVLFEYDVEDGISSNEKMIGHLRDGISEIISMCNDKSITETEKV